MVITTSAPLVVPGHRSKERQNLRVDYLPVSLNIKNSDTVRLAHRLAAATGESVTAAVTIAVRERLDRLHERDETAVSKRAAAAREIAEDAANRWIEPYRSTDHGDLLYDDSGLPR